MEPDYEIEILASGAPAASKKFFASTTLAKIASEFRSAFSIPSFG